MPLTILRCPPDPRLDLLQLKLELALLFCEGISSCGELLGMLFFHGVDYLLCLLHRFPSAPSSSSTCSLSAPTVALSSMTVALSPCIFCFMSPMVSRR